MIVGTLCRTTKPIYGWPAIDANIGLTLRENTLLVLRAEILPFLLFFTYLGPFVVFREKEKFLETITTGWVPPKMPEPLLQEKFYPDPWKVLVVCIMLNCTQRKQVEPMIDTFFARYPDAESYLKAYDCDFSRADIIDLLRPLGFYNRRAKRLYQFSLDTLYKGYSDPGSLHAVGPYGTACYEMLFLGRFGEEPPEDHALKDYWTFCKSQDVF